MRIRILEDRTKEGNLMARYNWSEGQLVDTPTYFRVRAGEEYECSIYKVDPEYESSLLELRVGDSGQTFSGWFTREEFAVIPE